MFSTRYHAIDHCPWLDPQKHDGPNSRAPRIYQAEGVTYDTGSGQVYTEKTVRAPKKRRTNWINEYKTPGLVKRRHTNGHGAASLFDMAKAKVAREMQYLTVSHLKGIPPFIGKKLWDEVENSRLETFHTWRTLVSAFPDSLSSPFRRYFLDIKESVVPLIDYFAALDSEAVKWLSCLRIAPSNIDRSDLVRISQLRNLAVLDLSDHPSIEHSGTQVDERIFKTWAEMAKGGQAFKHVRVILMRGQADVSTWLFKYLDIFPSLCFLVLSDCRLIHQKNRADWTDQASAHGWEARHSKKSAKSLRGLIDDKNFYLGAVSGCYYHTKEVFDQLATKKKSRISKRLPVVEVWIGKPKPWLHLIEEFPGTRTVWFDNVKTTEYARKAEARRRTEGPVLARAARCALPERIRTPPAEDGTKRTRDMLSSPGSDTKSPPHKRTTMMLRSRTKNLDHSTGANEPSTGSSHRLSADPDGCPGSEAAKFPPVDRGEDRDPAPRSPDRDSGGEPLGSPSRALGSVDSADRALTESSAIASVRSSVPASDRCEPPAPLGRNRGVPPRGSLEDAPPKAPEGRVLNPERDAPTVPRRSGDEEESSPRSPSEDSVLNPEEPPRVPMPPEEAAGKLPCEESILNPAIAVGEPLRTLPEDPVALRALRSPDCTLSEPAASSPEEPSAPAEFPDEPALLILPELRLLRTGTRVPSG